MTQFVCTLKKLVLYRFFQAKKKKNWQSQLLQVTFKQNNVWQKLTCVWLYLSQNAMLDVVCNFLTLSKKETWDWWKLLINLITQKVSNSQLMRLGGFVKLSHVRLQTKLVQSVSQFTWLKQSTNLFVNNVTFFKNLDKIQHQNKSLNVWIWLLIKFVKSWKLLKNQFLLKHRLVKKMIAILEISLKMKLLKIL